jgi:hypothetical protein
MANFFADMGTLPFDENYNLDSSFQFLEEATKVLDNRIQSLAIAAQKGDAVCARDHIYLFFNFFNYFINAIKLYNTTY